MTTYSLRCRNSKCRHRRVSIIHPDDYRRVPKCASCNTVSGWRIENRDYNKRNLCHCNGVVHPDGRQSPHRVTHPLCDQHPQGFYNQARQRGVAHEDIPAEYGGGRIDEE